MVVALVITIIELLILESVSIATLKGENGIVTLTTSNEKTIRRSEKFKMHLLVHTINLKENKLMYKILFYGIYWLSSRFITTTSITNIFLYMVRVVIAMISANLCFGVSLRLD